MLSPVNWNHDLDNDRRPAWLLCLTVMAWLLGMLVLIGIVVLISTAVVPALISDSPTIVPLLKNCPPPCNGIVEVTETPTLTTLTTTVINNVPPIAKNKVPPTEFELTTTTIKPNIETQIEKDRHSISSTEIDQDFIDNSNDKSEPGEEEITITVEPDPITVSAPFAQNTRPNTTLSSDVVRKEHNEKEEEAKIKTITLIPNNRDITVSTALTIFKPTVSPVFGWHNSRPSRPAFTVHKVGGRYNYDFYSESVTYEMSVDVCRRDGKGSQLLSFESSMEKRIIDAYVHSHQTEIFGRRENNNWFLWTGGYFDLDSNKPYDLHWNDKLERENNDYQHFCPESKNVRQLIDRILLDKKTASNIHPNLGCINRRRAHVIVDFCGNRISRSCWQIFDPEVLSPQDLHLPFVCKN